MLATTGDDRASNDSSCLAESITPSTADMRNGDDMAQGADDVETFLEEYISTGIDDADAAGDRESATPPRHITSSRRVLGHDHVEEDSEEASRPEHSIRSPSADTNTSSEDEPNVESEPDVSMDLDRESLSSSEGSEDVEVGRAASLLQRFEDALVENQEDEGEDEDNGESEAESQSEGAVEGSVKEGALVDSWLAQPIVYPVQRYSGIMNVEVCKFPLPHI